MFLQDAEALAIARLSLQTMEQMDGGDKARRNGYFKIWKKPLEESEDERLLVTLSKKEADEENSSYFFEMMGMSFANNEELEAYRRNAEEHGRGDKFYFRVACPACRDKAYAVYTPRAVQLTGPAEEVCRCRKCGHVYMSFCEGVPALYAPVAKRRALKTAVGRRRSLGAPAKSREQAEPREGLGVWTKIGLTLLGWGALFGLVYLMSS